MNRTRLVALATPLLLVAVLEGFLIRTGGIARADNLTTGTLRPRGNSIAADSHANRILVRGSSPSYRMAQNTNHATEQAQPVSSVPQQELRTYHCQPGTAQGMARRLQDLFDATPGVRIVCDDRTSQILVMAPEEIHARIAELGNFPQGEAMTAGGSQLPAVSPGTLPNVTTQSANGSREVQLWNTTGQKFETLLASELGDRLVPIAGTAPNAGTYRLTLANSQTLGISIDWRMNRVSVAGPRSAVESCVRLIHALDQPAQSGGPSVGLVSLRAARSDAVQQTVDAVQAQGSPNQQALIQDVLPGGEVPPGGLDEAAGLVGSVQVELLEGLDVLVIRGLGSDVARVVELIKQIEQLSIETEPVVEVYQLRHVGSLAMATLVSELYEASFSVRQGTVSVTGLVKPNAVLLIGRAESVATALEMVKKLDRPVAPDSQFKVFRLKHATAETIAAMIEEFYDDREQLGAEVRVVSDFRTNSLVVWASPRDIVEVEAMVTRLDTPDNAVVNEMRLFQLVNSQVGELGPVLEEAITDEAGTDTSQRSGQLTFLTVDAKGQRRLNSGILDNVHVTIDENSNTLLVSAPSQSMPLIEALIKELDRLPAVEAQIKVFTIVNGDASDMLDMLETLFGETTGADQLAIQTAAAAGEGTLAPLRFAIDVRTNSIIASGSISDLTVVEAILLRLDESDVQNRQSVVYRLKNAPAEDVANAINEFLSSERQVEQATAGLVSAFEQIEREVVVVAEPVSNSLIVSATPRYFEQIARLVEDLDEQPPMVMIQVLIAEVALNNTDEFGVELGIQDSILFDRSMLGDLITTTNSTQTSTADGVVTVTEEVIQAAANTPGFLFNNTSPLGNSGSDKAFSNGDYVASQGLGNFGVGRLNSELGFGGLVLSASSEAVSVLIRALQENRRVDILSRPQIMTLDGEQAYIQVGERVPRITASETNESGGLTNQVTLEDVGLILGVTPRVSPEGLVVMEINVEKSALGQEAEGIPVSISEGQVIRSPRIKTTEALTTVSVWDGQTVILGGLITEEKAEFHRQVPVLGDIPLIKHLFRYDGMTMEKFELLMIMTPHIVESEEDAEVIKQIETARMHWCLGDVIQIYEDVVTCRRSDEWLDDETTVIYPDQDMPVQLNPAPGSLIEIPQKMPPLDEVLPPPPEPKSLDSSRRETTDGAVQAAYYPRVGPARR